MDLEAAKKQLSKAKIQLMFEENFTFITHVCFSLIHEFSKEVPTAGTDGRRVIYNPDFFLSLTPAQQVGLVLHETWHVVFNHVGEFSRRGERNMLKWNYAGDYVINLILVDNNIELPPEGLLDFQYRGMSTEQVYNLLPDPPEDSSFQMDLMPPSGDPEELKAELEDLLIQAKVKSDMAGDKPGSIPGEIEVALDKLLNPKLPWDQILARYFTAFDKTEYTFRKPNRRFLPHHILPSAYGEALGHVAMAIDMSGSVSDEETNQFVSDAHSVIQNVKLKKLNLVQFDTRVFAVDEVRSTAELLSLRFAGRGGTNINPVLEWAQKEKPDVLVIFTDGYFSAPKSDPGVPVVWLIHNHKNFTAPFGKIIHYEI